MRPFVRYVSIVTVAFCAVAANAATALYEAPQGFETAALSLLAPPTARFRARAFFPFLAALTFLPLMFVSGAGAAGSRSLGTTFFGGFFASALLGTFLTLLIRQEKRSQVSPSG